MNKVTQNIIPLFVIFISFSCSNDGYESQNNIEIDIDDFGYKKSNLSINTKSIDIFPLETSEESVIGNIDRIEYYKGRFYVLDVVHGKTISVFLENGEFLTKIKHGNGPGEMINPFAFCIDKVKDQIHVWDQTLNTLFTMDLDLNHISDKRLNIFITDLDKIEGNFLVHSQNPLNKAYTYHLYSQDFEDLYSSFDLPYESSGGMYLYRHISISNENNLLITPNSYDIYEYAESEIKSLYHLDFGSKALDDRTLKTSVSLIWKRIKSELAVSTLMDIFESKSFIGFQVVFGQEPYTFLISKSNNSLLSFNNEFSRNSLPAFTIRGSIDTRRNTFYGIIDSNDILSYLESSQKDLGLDKKPTTDDNPYILFVEVE